MNLLESNTYNALLKRITEDNKELMNAFDGKTVMITGAAGMIGSFIADVLMCACDRSTSPCRVISTGRNIDNLRKRFSEYTNNEHFVMLQQDVTKEITVNEQVDYIIHAASNADPANFSKYPTETFLANIIGTYNLLEFCRKNDVKRFEFISSGEFYGSSEGIEGGFKENDMGKLDFSSSRVCFGEGTRSA